MSLDYFGLLSDLVADRQTRPEIAWTAKTLEQRSIQRHRTKRLDVAQTIYHQVVYQSDTPAEASAAFEAWALLLLIILKPPTDKIKSSSPRTTARATMAPMTPFTAGLSPTRCLSLSWVEDAGVVLLLDELVL